jgi:hypothetical protein
VFNGGCPVGCAVDEDCVGDLGPGVCAGGQCCDLTNVSEVLSLLDAVQNGLNAPCDHPCPPGGALVLAQDEGKGKVREWEEACIR